ncbi:MAG TPA: glycine--tRNA ligase subunit alpha [Thermoanaerobaculia bacterium]|nr:glycine--tRNA ligase subunit alpha [Thermoanaerobaculia bacterium]
MSAAGERSLATLAATLVDGWVGNGCVVLDPWDGELSARSMAPQAFFALAGERHVRWVTRQVVREPSEARYGRSPVRQVRSTQIRVLLRPTPEDLFGHFVASLRPSEQGLDECELRLRPTEWRVRDLGVQGSGWLALMDGLLVARFIDLRVAGGSAVDPTATEITYGVERLALVASSDRSLRRLQQEHCAEYAVQRRDEEQELSRHLLEVLEEGELMRRLERELAAAQRSLDERLPVPAFESILRGISCAEVLRARGAFRTLREARAGKRLTELSGGCRRLVGSAHGAGERTRSGDV